MEDHGTVVQPWLRQFSGASAVLEISQPIVLRTVTLHESRSSRVMGPEKPKPRTAEWLVWAQYTPAETGFSADGLYTACPSIVLGQAQIGTSLTMKLEFRLPGSLKVWLEDVTGANECAVSSDAAAVGDHTSLATVPDEGVEVTLVGAPCPTEHLHHDRAESMEMRGARWRPLLAVGWFSEKLDGGSACGTKEPRLESHHPPARGDAPSCARRALAVSRDGKLLLLSNLETRKAREMEPFRRVFTPASAQNVIRIRRYPHRFADVVGVMAFGDTAVAVGEEIDEFTQERYVLLLSPTPPSGLTPEEFSAHTGVFLESGSYLWGWSKVAGSGGVTFLNEVTSVGPVPRLLSTSFDSSWGSHRHITTRFQVPKLFMSTRVKRGVRIRSAPSLNAPEIGYLHPNEVKQAIASCTVGATESAVGGNPGSCGGFCDFVQWCDGGYSLQRNTPHSYLREVVVDCCGAGR